MIKRFRILLFALLVCLHGFRPGLLSAQFRSYETADTGVVEYPPGNLGYARTFAFPLRERLRLKAADAPQTDSVARSSSSQRPAAAPQRAIYVEGGGSAIWYSVNYEYRYRKHLSGRVGYGAWNPAAFGYFLVMVNYLIGTRSHWLETGVGVRFGLRDDSNTEALTMYLSGLPVTIGYRYQPPKTGLLFRLSFTPLREEPYFWGGVSLGYEF